MNWTLFFMDAIGVVSFSIATIFAFRNNKDLGFKAFDFWNIFASASIVALLWSLNLVLGDIEIKMPFFEESMLFFGVAFLFMMVALSSYFNFVKPKNVSRKK